MVANKSKSKTEQFFNVFFFFFVNSHHNRLEARKTVNSNFKMSYRRPRVIYLVLLSRFITDRLSIKIITHGMVQPGSCSKRILVLSLPQRDQD